MRVLTQLHRVAGPSQNLIKKLTNNSYQIQALSTTATKSAKKKSSKRRPSDPQPRPDNYVDLANTPIIRSHITNRKSIATPSIPFSERLLQKQSPPTTTGNDNNNNTNSTVVDTQPPLLHDFTSLQSQMSPKLLRLFHLTNANASQLAKARKARAIEMFQLRPGDTGSSAAQIVALTSRIQQMTAHMGVHRKDFSGKRGLDALYVKRRKMLDYLERTDFDTYRVVVKALNLVR
eukprot:CAMPEP_0198264242 /NCGR_PEP_ID=MMETSP1447-20131203/14966_1 /TAXON_ID=420782 /ORGANISM="Chaetoceros dichaeta, Strain CCMP1751" /LENGTH=232 /DNA_ID=CAMNT_0043953111 /DNA_START=19 /DNA_END=717 /DNA_ORIENTATION=+